MPPKICRNIKPVQLTIPSLILSILLCSCSVSGVNKTAEKAIGKENKLMSGAFYGVDLFKGKVLAPWSLYIHNHKTSKLVSSQYASLPSGELSVRVSAQGHHDALKISWRDTWSSRVSIEGAEPLQLIGLSESAVFNFDIKINEFKKAGLDLVVNCGGFSCRRSVSLSDYARNSIGLGWRNVSVPMHCLSLGGNDFSSLSLPFSLEMGSQGPAEIELAKIQFLAADLVSGKQKTDLTLDCIPYAQRATTPAVLSEYWAIDWWMERHEGKLEELAQKEVELLFIGDSITQGWE
jgi:beta-glucosidase